jgi:hypothetical protein
MFPSGGLSLHLLTPCPPLCVLLPIYLLLNNNFYTTVK